MTWIGGNRLRWWCRLRGHLHKTSIESLCSRTFRYTECRRCLAEYERSRTMNGAERIAVERQRQIEVEGWTAEHDAEHMDGDLVSAAMCYADHAVGSDWLIELGWDPLGEAPSVWPWDAVWWKPSDDPIRDLVRAGALIAAAIDQLLRRAGEEQE